MNIVKYIKNKFNLELRFVCAGVVNTVFGYLCYSLLIFMGMGMYLATLAAHIMGSIFNLFSYGKFVFKKNISLKKSILFFLNYVILYFLNISLNNFFFNYYGNYYISGLIALIFVIMINFILLKKIFS